MSESLPPDHANLLEAAKRARRTLWVWAVLSLAMGMVTLAVIGTIHPVAAAPWLLTALLLALSRQPAFFALVAAQWLLTLILHLPGPQAAFGPEPVAAMVGAEGVEAFGLLLVRAVIAVAAWNQFLTYRLLYGTEAATGPIRELPLIPEIIPNRTDRLALAAPAAGLLSVAGAGLALLLPAGGAVASADMAAAAAVYAVGFGLGAAFSPTRRRGAALAGAGAGLVGFLSALAAGRLLAG